MQSLIEVVLPRKGRSSWKSLVQQDTGKGWRQEDTTEMAPLKLWLLSLFLPSEQLGEAHPQLYPSTETWGQHSKILGTSKSCIFWAKEQTLPAVVAARRFRSARVTEKHRGFCSTNHLFCIEHNNSPRSHFSLPACQAQNIHQLPLPLQI